MNHPRISLDHTRSLYIIIHTIISYSILSLDQLNNSDETIDIDCHVFFESSRFDDHQVNKLNIIFILIIVK
jgi:hypothetical protein